MHTRRSKEEAEEKQIILSPLLSYIFWKVEGIASQFFAFKDMFL